MQKLLWLALFAVMVGTGVAVVQSDVPPFNEGPQAQRMNQMSEEAPHGPWQGGPEQGP